METYQAMREFADSWGLLYMMLVFIGVVIFAFRPGSREYYKQVAQIPLDEE